jgi:hypothetical protein
MEGPKPVRDQRIATYHRGTYRGIRYEAVKLDEGDRFEELQRQEGSLTGRRQPRGHWCGYVYLDLARIKDPEQRKGLLPVPKNIGRETPCWHWHYSNTAWRDAPFYGYCSYAEVISGCPDPAMGPFVKVGADWNHLWDDEAGSHGSLDRAEHNMVEVIDWLIATYPELKPEGEAT